MRSVISAGLATAVLAPAVAGLNAIGIKGQELVDGTTGDRFQLVGAAYQPGGAAGYDPTSKKDPLSNADQCRRDAAVLQSIGSNAIRVYNLDPDINHDECASIFNAAGMYMVIDVNSPLPNESINEDNPGSSYHKTYLTRAFKLMDAFRGYPNTLAFFSANELISKPDSGKKNSPYIRAVTRDLHQYMRARGGRVIPIGYSAADIRDLLADTTNYLTCAIDGEANNDSKSDFIGLNGYSWCGDVTDWKTGQYDQLASLYSGATFPVFMSEYGCNKVMPRHFNEISAIYNKDQMPMISGGLAYEYTMEDNNYGLVKVKSDNEIELLDDLNTLAQKFSGIDKTYLKTANSSATSLTPPKCDSSLIKGDKIPNSWKVPAQPDGVADLIKSGVPGSRMGQLVQVSLDVPSNMKAKWTNGTEMSLKLTQKSTSDQLGDTTGSSAPGAGAAGSSGASTKNAAGERITPAAQGTLLVAAMSYLLTLL